MWDSSGKDNEKTIQELLSNKDFDLVIMNIAAHIQMPPLPGQLQKYMTFLEKISSFYDKNFKVEKSERKMVPLLWKTMNPHYPEKKPPIYRFQTTLLSNIYNDISYYTLGEASIPIINFSSMMKNGFPWTSRDGIHSSKFVDIMKNQILLNYLCNFGDFNTDFLLGEGYKNKVRGI